MNLTENFTLAELTASSVSRLKGIENIPDERSLYNLKRLCVEVLQPVRNRFSRPITVTSGYRSKELNKAVGGSETSQHKNGEAADIISEDNAALWHTIVGMIRAGEIKVGQLIDEKDLRAHSTIFDKI